VNRSKKSFSVQPMHGCPAPIGQLVCRFHWMTGQALKVLGPLQPTSYRHQPLRAPSSSKVRTNSPASKWARRGHESWIRWS
jgi:hypothetical protein